MVRGETWTVLRRRAGHDHAVRFLDRLATTERHDEREYSFVEATSFALMRHFICTLLVAAGAGALIGAVADSSNWEPPVAFALMMVVSTGISLVALRGVLFGSTPNQRQTGRTRR